MLRVWLLLWLLFLKNLTGPSGYCMVDHYVSNLGTRPSDFRGSGSKTTIYVKVSVRQSSKFSSKMVSESI